MPISLPASTSISCDHENELRRSKRHRIEHNFGPDFVTSFLVENLDPDRINEDIASVFFIENDPKTSIDASFWKEAINSELDSIKTNHTWDLVDLPRDVNLLGANEFLERK